MLNNEQELVVKEFDKFLKSKKECIILNAKAGTGKTYTAGWFLSRLPPYYKVAVATLSHKAKAVLKSKISSYTVDYYTLASILNMKLDMLTGDFLEDKGLQNKIEQYRLIVIDEASMVSESCLKLLLKKKHKECKIIFLLDFRQLPPIGEKESALLTSKYKTLTLDYRVRQGSNNSILDYSDRYGDEVLKANPDKIIVDRVNDNNIEHSTDIDETINKYKDLFIQGVKEFNPNIIRIICYTNKMKEELNNKIRTLLFNKSSDTPYLKGDLLVLDNQHLKFENGSELLVTNNAYTSIEDYNLIVWKIPVKVLHDDGYDEVGIVSVIDKDNEVRFNKVLNNKYDEYLLATGKTKWKLLKEYWDFRNKYAKVSYNFCVSFYKAQGSSYDYTILYESNLYENKYLDNKILNSCMYVGITRSKKKTILIYEK